MKNPLQGGHSHENSKKALSKLNQISLQEESRDFLGGVLQPGLDPFISPHFAGNNYFLGFWEGGGGGSGGGWPCAMRLARSLL